MPASVPDLSIVATVYNDAEVVSPLVQEIFAAAEPLEISIEVVLVDDHSSDDTGGAIRAECQRDPRVRGLTLARNYGQQIAVSAGIDAANGRYLIVMDGDLQNPPAAIPRIYAELCSSGADVVYTISHVRNGWVDAFTSRVFWFTLERVLKVRMVKHQLMMRGMTRRVADSFRRYGESTRVVGGIMADMGFQYRVLEVENRPRVRGRSHYRFGSRVALGIDLVLALSNRPLDALINLGALGVLIASIASGYHLYTFLFRDVTPGFTSLILSIVFFGSANMMILGIIGRYLSNIYREVRGRPLYLVEKVFNH